MNKNQWIAWGVTTIGPLHIKSGLPNQDAMLSKKYKWGEIIAVSDGVGSRARSDIGSKAICWSVVQASKILFKSKKIKIENIQIEEFLRLLHSIWLVKIYPYSPKECSATCLFTIRNADKLLLEQLGDGLIVATSTNSNSEILNDDKEDSFSNVTYSAGSNFNFEQWKYTILDANEYNSVLLCTDGISDDLISGSECDFAKGLYESYGNCKPRKRYYEILHWLKNWPTPKHTDDKTIACLNKVSNNG